MLTIIDGGKEGAAARRKLTPKQESFVAALIRGQSQYDAYRGAYNANGMRRSAIDTEAWRLAGHPEISRRVLAAQASVERAAEVSAGARRRFVLQRLEHEATTSASDSARVRALELLGRTTDVALFSDHLVIDAPERSPDQLREELQQRLRALLSMG